MRGGVNSIVRRVAPATHLFVPVPCPAKWTLHHRPWHRVSLAKNGCNPEHTLKVSLQRVPESYKSDSGRPACRTVCRTAPCARNTHTHNRHTRNAPVLFPSLPRRLRLTARLTPSDAQILVSAMSEGTVCHFEQEHMGRGAVHPVLLANHACVPVTDPCAIH